MICTLSHSVMMRSVCGQVQSLIVFGRKQSSDHIDFNVNRWYYNAWQCLPVIKHFAAFIIYKVVSALRYAFGEKPWSGRQVDFYRGFWGDLTRRKLSTALRRFLTWKGFIWELQILPWKHFVTRYLINRVRHAASNFYSKDVYSINKREFLPLLSDMNYVAMI